MNPTLTPSPASRLERLDAYLKQDPANAALLADAYETAIACGEHARAMDYIESAGRLDAGRTAEWTFRRARLAIAVRDLAAAAGLLEQLVAQQGPHPVLAHDLAYVRLLQGDLEACREVLRPWLEPDAAPLAPAELQPMQVLWLRAEHRLQHIDDAMAWAKSLDRSGALTPLAQGVASLIALDGDDFDSAQRWAEAALRLDPAQHEALVAAGSVALLRGDAEAGVQLLERALARHPDDGRSWSALGLASLQAMQLPQAQAQLERAVAVMPDHVECWHALAWARVLQGDRDGALAALHEALSIDPSHADTHAAQGLVLALAGNRPAAESALAAAEQLEPNNFTAGYARALLSGAGKDPQALQELAKRVLEQSGTSGARLQAALQGLARRRT